MGRIKIFIFQVTHIVLSTNTGYGLKYVLKYSLHYINIISDTCHQ